MAARDMMADLLHYMQNAGGQAVRGFSDQFRFPDIRSLFDAGPALMDMATGVGDPTAAPQSVPAAINTFGNVAQNIPEIAQAALHATLNNPYYAGGAALGMALTPPGEPSPNDIRWFDDFVGKNPRSVPEGTVPNQEAWNWAGNQLENASRRVDYGAQKWLESYEGKATSAPLGTFDPRAELMKEQDHLLSLHLARKHAIAAGDAAEVKRIEGLMNQSAAAANNIAGPMMRGTETGLPVGPDWADSPGDMLLNAQRKSTASLRDMLMLNESAPPNAPEALRPWESKIIQDELRRRGIEYVPNDVIDAARRNMEGEQVGPLDLGGGQILPARRLHQPSMTAQEFVKYRNRPPDATPLPESKVGDTYWTPVSGGIKWNGRRWIRDVDAVDLDSPHMHTQPPAFKNWLEEISSQDAKGPANVLDALKHIGYNPRAAETLLGTNIYERSMQQRATPSEISWWQDWQKRTAQRRSGK